MSATQPFAPHPGSNQPVVLAAGVAQVITVTADNRNLRIANAGANPAHFRAYDSRMYTVAPVASEKECPVLANMASTFTKGITQDSVTLFSTLGTTVHVCTGEGW